MRILATFSLALSAAIFIAIYLLPVFLLLPLIFTVLILCAALFLLKRNWLRGIELALFGFGIGLLIFLVKYNFTAAPCRALDGQTIEISGVLLDYPDIYDNYCRVELKLDGGNTPRVKALIYDYDKALASAKPGQRLSCIAKLRAADRRYGEEYRRYTSDGIFFTVSIKSEVEIRDSVFSLAALEGEIRKTISQRISDLYPEKISAFLNAATLGDKSGLYEHKDLYFDISDAGIMHVAAVSGMHIAFLVGLLQLIFGAGKNSAVICIAFIWCFVVITGASTSAVRAGFMQSLLLFAPVVRRENDPITSLSAVLAIVLIKNPYAAASVSLQLSFSAMAGIMLFGRKFFNLITEGMSKKVKKLLNYPVAILSSSLSVMVFTLPLSVLYFGYVPILSPVSNILSLWAVSFSFCGAYISVFLSCFLPILAKAAAFIVYWSVEYIFAVVKFIASLPFCTVYLREELVIIWIISSYLLLAILSLSRIKDRYKLIISVLSVFMLLFSILGITRLSFKKDLCNFTVLDVGQGQSIAVTSRDNAVLIDCGGGAKLEGAGSIAASYLQSCGKNHLDAVILTHLHSDHTNGVLELMERVSIDKLIIYADAEDDEEILPLLENSAAVHGVELVKVSEDMFLDFGCVHAELFTPESGGNRNEKSLMCLVGAFDKEMLITGDAPMGAENKLLERCDLSGCEFLVAGHHGSRTSCGVKLVENIGADTAIISVGYNNYGHPNTETIARLMACNYNILRTDINGTVEIRIR